LLVFFGFALKLVLQLISSIPSIALLALAVRMYVIAYLHLVVIGVISFFLLAWYYEQQWITITVKSFAFLLIGFVGSELTMILVGMLPSELLQKILFISSMLLVIGLGWILTTISFRDKISA